MRPVGTMMPPRFTDCRSSPFQLAAVAAILYIVVLSPFLGISSIGGSSEAREVHVAAIIERTGEWVLPLRNGVVPSKPILFHWITALLGDARGGVTPGVARGTSLLFGAGTLALTFLLGYAVTRGWDAARRRTVGVMSACILASMYGFSQLAIDARVDMTFSFFAVLALVALTWPFAKATPRAGTCLVPLGGWEWSLFYGACGCAVLAKGPIGLVLPVLLGFGGLVSLVGFRAALKAFLTPRWGWLLFLIIALPWYLLAAERGAGAFVERQLVFENLRRFTGAEHMNNQPGWFYVESVLRGASPWWIPFAFFGLAMRWRGSAGDPVRLEHRLRALGVVWFVLGVVFLSLAAGKRHSYLLPLLPGMAVVTACGLEERFLKLSDYARGRWDGYAGVIAGWLGVVALGVVGIGVIAVALDLSFSPLLVVFQRLLVENGGALTVAGLTVVVLHLGWLSGRTLSPRGAWIVAALSIVWLLGLGIAVGSGAKSALKGFDRMARVVAERSDPAAPLVLLKTRYNEYFDPFLFYLGRSVRIEPPEVESVRCGVGEQYLARRDWFDEVQGQGGIALEEIVTVHQTHDDIVGRKDRGITLFRCGATLGG